MYVPVISIISIQLFSKKLRNQVKVISNKKPGDHAVTGLILAVKYF